MRILAGLGAALIGNAVGKAAGTKYPSTSGSSVQSGTTTIPATNGGYLRGGTTTSYGTPYAAGLQAKSEANNKSKDGSADETNNKTNDKDNRLKGNPGDVNKQGTSETKIGSDGNATRERHNTDHGNPKIHTNPHDHDIKWRPDGSPEFGPPINYPNGAPPFK